MTVHNYDPAMMAADVDNDEKAFADLRQRHFKARAKLSLENEQLRGSFLGATDFLQAKRRTVFADASELEQLCNRGESIRQQSLAQLPDLL